MDPTVVAGGISFTGRQDAVFGGFMRAFRDFRAKVRDMAAYVLFDCSCMQGTFGKNGNPDFREVLAVLGYEW